MPSSRVFSQPGDQTQVSHISQVDSLPSEPPGKPLLLAKCQSIYVYVSILLIYVLYFYISRALIHQVCYFFIILYRIRWEKFTSFWQVKNMLYLNYVSFMYVCAQWLSHIWLVDPMECSLPRLSVHGLLQARILERVAISYSRGSSQPRDQTHVSSIGS